MEQMPPAVPPPAYGPPTSPWPGAGTPYGPYGQVWPPPVARLIEAPPRPRPTWDHPGLLAAVVGVSFILCLGLAVAAVLLKWRPGFFVAEMAAFFLPALIYTLLLRIEWSSVLGMRLRVAAGLPLAVVAAAGAWAFATSLIGWFLRALSLSPEAREQAAEQMALLMGCTNPYEWLWTILALVVAAPIAEEMMFRGLLQRGLERRWNRWLALIVASLVFAAVHVQPLQFPILFLLGLLFGWLFQRSGSLWPGVAGHATNNLLAVFAFNGIGTMDEVVQAAWWPTALGAGLAGGAVATLVYGLMLRRRPRPAPKPALAPIFVPPPAACG
jgi:membrane protease YdiL (CAAX protease family)